MRIVSLQPDDSSEKKSIQTIHALCGEYHRQADIIPVRSTDGLLHWLADAELVLAQRFHGALAAFALGIPMIVIAQGKDDKLSELQATAENGISADDLHELVENGFSTLADAFPGR